MYKIKHAGFTLIELLVVIAIIGLLVTLSVLALSNARVAARDSKRVSDVKQMQSALELFFDANNRYPTNAEFQSGSLKSFASTTGTTTYMSIIPAAPTPNDGSCSTSSNNYVYIAPADGSTYTLSFCVAKNINDLPSGRLAATPGGMAARGFQCGDSVSYAGESYPTVSIGTQCWFAKNLDIGTMITSTSTGSLPVNDGLIEKYCYINNQTACITYGGFYTWYEAMQLPAACNNGTQIDCTANPTNSCCTTANHDICPAGWHLPSDVEQNILDQYLWDPSVSPYTCGAGRNGTWECANAGTKLRTGGFAGLLAGDRSIDGSFVYQGSYAFLWSSSVSGASAWNRYLVSGGVNVYRSTGSRAYGFSVRCLKD